MKLYNHQQKIIDENKPKTGLWLGTGSGKTRTALLLARGRTLVICPKTQAEDGNWQRELEKIIRESNSVIRLSLQSNIDSLSVMSKEQFKKNVVNKKIGKFDTVIVDEAHTCLGATPSLRYVKGSPVPKVSQLFQALKDFIEQTKPERLYLCTATIIRSPMTVWAAGVLLGMKWSFWEWRAAFYFKLNIPNREIYVPKTDDASKERLAKNVRKIGYTGRLEDYFDVPEQTHKVIHVELTRPQIERIRELPLEYPDPIVLIGKKHQVENGVLSGDEYNEPEKFDNNKIDTIYDLSLEFPRMIVFVKYTAQIFAIAQALRKENKKVFTMTGDVGNRGEILQLAKDSEEYVFIVQAQISAGWELPECPVMVFASMDWSYVSYAQGIGRILRANHLKKNLYISLVVKGGIDERVYDTIMNKEDFNLAIYNKRVVE